VASTFYVLIKKECSLYYWLYTNCINKIGITLVRVCISIFSFTDSISIWASWESVEKNIT